MESKKLEKPRENGTFSTVQGVMKPDEEDRGVSPAMKAESKIRQLEYEFDIPMENHMGEELNQMCNLSDYVEEIGIQKGIEQGKEQLLTQLIMKKYAKGKSTAVIADELEEDEKTIRNILEKALNN